MINKTWNLEILGFQGKWVTSQFLLKLMLELLIIWVQSKFRIRNTMRNLTFGLLAVWSMKLHACILLFKLRLSISFGRKSEKESSSLYQKQEIFQRKLKVWFSECFQGDLKTDQAQLIFVIRSKFESTMKRRSEKDSR